MRDIAHQWNQYTMPTFIDIIHTKKIVYLSKNEIPNLIDSKLHIFDNHKVGSILRNSVSGGCVSFCQT